MFDYLDVRKSQGHGKKPLTNLQSAISKTLCLLNFVQFSCFVQLSRMNSDEKAYFECAASKRWLNYTTQISGSSQLWTSPLIVDNSFLKIFTSPK